MCSLLSNFQPLDDRAISFDVLLLEIIEEMAPLPNELQKPPAGMVILHVGLEMLGQIADPFAQDGDLYLWRPGVRGVPLVSLNDSFLLLWQ
jgi:hypothetical protein